MSLPLLSRLRPSAPQGVFMRVCFPTVFLLLTLTAAASPDVFIQQRVQSKAVKLYEKDIKNLEETVDIWMSEDAVAFHTPRISRIFDRKSGFLIVINHRTKSYVRVKLPLNPEEIFPGTTADFIKNSLASLTVILEDTGEKKVIGGMDCSEYKINVSYSKFLLEMRLWTARDISPDWETIDSHLYYCWTQLHLPLGDQAKSAFEKIQGLIIAAETAWSFEETEWTTTSEITEITEKPAEENTYAIPEGYKEKDTLNPDDLR